MTKFITLIFFQANYLIPRIPPVGRRKPSVRIAVQRPSEKKNKRLRLVNLVMNPPSALLDSFKLTRVVSTPFRSAACSWAVSWKCPWAARHVNTRSCRPCTCRCTRFRLGNVAFIIKIIKSIKIIISTWGHKVSMGSSIVSWPAWGASFRTGPWWDSFWWLWWVLVWGPLGPCSKSSWSCSARCTLWWTFCFGKRTWSHFFSSGW